MKMTFIKRLSIVICLLVPVIASAMKIEKDALDEFTGKRTLFTSWEGICTNNIHILFRLQNGHQYLDFKKHVNGAIVIAEDDLLCFKSTTDQMTSFHAIRSYMGERGGGAVGLNGSGNWGISATYKGDLGYFNNNTIRLIRLYSTDGYYDNTVKENDGKKLQKLYSLFLDALNGGVGAGASYKDYTVTYFKSTNKGKTWEQVDEKFFRNLSPEEIKSKIDEWKSKSDEKYLYDCKIKKD